MPDSLSHPTSRAPHGLKAQRRPFTLALAGLLVATTMAVGCTQAAATPDSASHATSKSSTPKGSADEICGPMIQENVPLQISTGKVIGKPVLTKSGSVTTCVYKITGGELRMTVDERSSDSAAENAFDEVRDAAGPTTPVANLGTASFIDSSSTTVTVKDNKILTIDPTQLPDGNDKTQIAQSLSFEVLTCWTH